MDRAKVLILETHAKATVPIIESCVAMGLYVIAGSHKRHCCGMYCKGVNERLLYPNIVQVPDRVAEHLLGYVRNNDISVIIPAGGLMAELIVRHQSQFKEHTNFLLPSYESFKKGLDKILTLKTATQIVT